MAVTYLHDDAAKMPVGSLYSGDPHGITIGPGKLRSYGFKGALVVAEDGAVRTAGFMPDDSIRLGSFDSYNRIASSERFVPPYIFEGEIEIHARQNRPKIWVESNRRPTWDHGICLFPAHVDGDNNVVTRLGAKGKDTLQPSNKIGTSREVNKDYLDPTPFAQRSWSPLPYPESGRYKYAIHVPNFGEYIHFWNGQLVHHVYEAGVPPWLFPVQVGFRVDFYDITFHKTRVRTGTAITFAPTRSTSEDNMHLVRGRILDTREGAPLKAGGTTVLVLPPVVPDNAVGVALTFAAVNPEADGHLTVWGASGMPFDSSLNYQKGQTIANFDLVELDARRSIQVYSHAKTHLIVGLRGYWV